MPKVSVIVPVYGVEKYIERCARSLFEQTLDDMEYLFIDDCSPDCSVKILKGVLDDYPHRKNQVIIHRMLQNSGQAAVRKWGIQNATGEYVIHCDSDDWVDTTIYQKLYDKAILENSDIVVCGFNETDGYNILKSSIHCFDTKEEYISNMLCMKDTWAVWNKLCKRDLCNTLLFPEHNMGEDMYMTFQLVLKAPKISIVKEFLYNYYYNRESITKVQAEEKRYNNWRQSVSNAQCVFELLQRTHLAYRLTDDIEFQKYKQKKLAGNLAYNRRFAKEWFLTFKSTHSTFFRIKRLSLIERIKYSIVILLSWIKSDAYKSFFKI